MTEEIMLQEIANLKSKILNLERNVDRAKEYARLHMSKFENIKDSMIFYREELKHIAKKAEKAESEFDYELLKEMAKNIIEALGL